jgi:Lrp/AsnC family leucine-responsive transcriptional regulator
MIDAVDIKILSILREDARVAAAEVARRVGMAPSAVFERMRRLEERGIVKGYAPIIDPHTIGYGLLAFVAVSAREGPGIGTGRALARVTGVQEVHHIAGSDDYLVKIRAADTEALGRVLREEFKAIPSVRSTRTTVVLETLKESPVIEDKVAPAAAAAPQAGAEHAGNGKSSNGAARREHEAAPGKPSESSARARVTRGRLSAE